MTAFSQAGTKTITTDSVIPLPKNVAKEVVKDVLRKDSCEAELTVAQNNIKILQDNNNQYTKVIASKDSLITDYKHLRTNDSLVINKKDEQKFNLEVTVNTLGQQVKKAKRQTTWIGVIGGVLVAALGYLVITK